MSKYFFPYRCGMHAQRQTELESCNLTIAAGLEKEKGVNKKRSEVNIVT